MTTGEDNNVELIARYEKCPWCGSTDRMMGRLGKEMKEKGLLEEGMDVGLVEIGGPIIDPDKIGQTLAVSTRPGMYALRDICIGCGREITVKIEKKITVLGINPPQGGLPMSGMPPMGRPG